MTLASPTLTVTADVAVEEIDEFAVGDVVIVEQLDDSTFDAVVVEIADVATDADGQDATDDDGHVRRHQRAGGLHQWSVTIITESSRIDGAMVVPSRALIALREGRYRRRAPSGEARSTDVGVEIGTFDDGGRDRRGDPRRSRCR